MALTAGARLGPFEVVALIGEGGMGQVYRATDTNLKRTVAIKVLPDRLANDAERLARFQREAEMLASLNHPNIAAIYGLERTPSTTALVMELVEGPTLADRISRGPIPADEAHLIATQIADALEAAHEHGIIHRDLKPANVKVRPDGMVKILDFGLGKALNSDSIGPPKDLSHSPTLTGPVGRTEVGVLLGTAAYMSPEQARGKPVDKRADIWAFGCVLYEMLSGQQAFFGETVSETLADVMKSEPRWTALPYETPAALRNVIRRCLEKNPRERIRDIGDVRLAMQGVFDTAASDGTARNRPRSLWQRPFSAAVFPLSLALLAGLASAVALWQTSRPAPRVVVRLAITTPETAPLTTDAGVDRSALAPDGQTLIYVGGRGPQRRLYVRRLDQIDILPVAGTEGAVAPFFSPDSQWVGFAAAGELKKVRLAGGPPATVCKLPGVFHGGSWGTNDVILFAVAQSGLLRVPAAGGQAKPATMLQAGELEHGAPEILPDAKTALFNISKGFSTGMQQVGVVSLDEMGQRRAFLDGLNPRYTSTGHIVFWRTGALWAVPFDLGRLEPVGDPVPVVEGVAGGGAIPPTFSMSAEGTLLYVPTATRRDPQRTLVVVDRKGNATPVLETRGDYFYPRFSPDGRRVAVNVGGGSSASGEIRICELERPACARLTSGNYPVWTPDGSRLTFTATNQSGDDDLYWMRADGSGEAEPLLIRPSIQWPFSWSPDGHLLAFNEISPAGGVLDLWVLPRGGEPTRLVVTSFDERMATFIPTDGKWFAYQSDESGGMEIYVRPYPGPGGRQLVSANGGREAVWSRNGRELFYREGSRLMAVSIDRSSGLVTGIPQMLFDGYDTLVSGTNFDVSPDGQQFVMVQGSQVVQRPLELRLVLNWLTELQRLVPTN